MLQVKTDHRIYGSPRQYVAEEEEKLMLIPERVKNSVVFIGCRIKNKAGVIEEWYGGTGFFVSVPTNAVAGSITYLVTAKHNIDGIKKYGIDGKSLFRINTVKGSVEVVDVPIEAWKFHPTESDHVDVAVISLPGISQKMYDAMNIPLSMAVTKEVIATEKIEEGEGAFVVGLFKHHYGTSKNYPIIRSGNIALFPEDKVDTGKPYGLMEAYLVESRSIGGISGSPVFVSRDVYELRNGGVQFRPEGAKMNLWLGLVHGHFINAEAEIDFMEKDIDLENKKLNIGISIVVPAEKILEVINQPEFVKEREFIEASLRIQKTTTED